MLQRSRPNESVSSSRIRDIVCPSAEPSKTTNNSVCEIIIIAASQRQKASILISDLAHAFSKLRTEVTRVYAWMVIYRIRNQAHLQYIYLSKTDWESPTRMILYLGCTIVKMRRAARIEVFNRNQYKNGPEYFRLGYIKNQFRVIIFDVPSLSPMHELITSARHICHPIPHGYRSCTNNIVE